MQIEKYKLLKDSSANDLSVKVNSYLEQGWILYGNPGVATDERYNHYIQAVVLLKK